jgi:hypothetical protein
VRLRPLIAAGAVAAATVAVFVVSRGKWSDPLIDSGREWIVPDALARGGLLYRDVVYWFGPLTPYFQAAFLRAFGSGFAGLVAAGVVTAAATLAALFTVLTRVTGRREAKLWTALAIPALVFMPNAGGALLGMGYRIWQAATLALLAVAVASRASAARPRLALAVAGACAGLAGLCRTEWGVASLAAVALAAALQWRRRDSLAGGLVCAGLGFAGVFGLGLGAFVLAAGSGAVVRDGHVLLTGLPQETRHFLVAFSGVADWPRGLAELVYSTAMWIGVFLLAALFARPAGISRNGVLKALAVTLAILAATALVGGAGSAVLFSAAPLVSLAGLLAGLRRRRGASAAALAACGFLGLLLSYRRPFHIGDSAYVGPPLLFAFVSAAGLLHLALAREETGAVRVRLGRSLRRVLAGLAVAAFAGRALQYASIEGVPIGGTSGMLTARSELAREIEELSAQIRSKANGPGGLVVFPEGELLNLLSGRPNPIRHKLYLPGYLTEQNERDVLAELERTPPAAIVLWRRPVSEYDHGLFGEDYGRSVRKWIDENYHLEPFRATGAPARANPRFVLGLRKETP